MPLRLLAEHWQMVQPGPVADMRRRMHPVPLPNDSQVVTTKPVRCSLQDIQACAAEWQHARHAAGDAHPAVPRHRFRVDVEDQ